SSAQAWQAPRAQTRRADKTRRCGQAMLHTSPDRICLGTAPARRMSVTPDRPPPVIRGRGMTTPSTLDPSLGYALANATVSAAMAAERLVGRGDEQASEEAAAAAMRAALAQVEMAGLVVVGEADG